MKSRARFSFGHLSIQQRLPLLICVLLLAVIVIYGFANYYSLRKGTLWVAGQRLSAVTTQVSSIFGQSEEFLTKTSNVAASQNQVSQFITSGGRQFQSETVAILDKLHRDSTWVLVELLDSNLAPVLRSGKSTLTIDVNLKDEINSLAGAKGRVGNIHNVKGLVFFPIISAVEDKGHTIGYVVSWIALHSNPNTVAQFSQLVGIGANFYIGNTDGSLWTDLVKPLTVTPFIIKDTNKLIEFTGEDGREMIANAQAIQHTPWYIAIAFSEETVLQPVTGFLNWIIVIGIVLIGTGMFAAWVMSRNITTPLNNLTNASSAIAGSSHLTPVWVDMKRNDELGKLAEAFNTMAADVHKMQRELEDKVLERTSQLQLVNKELEAFSYSVSHDLRTPLRAISGYSAMLKEDFEGKLGAEGDRVIKNIVSNARMMGQLIDDLLAFSWLGRKDLVRETVDMQALANSALSELLFNTPENKYNVNIAALPNAEADKGMVKQVFMNLLGNAIKYSSKKDSPVIEIGYKQEGQGVIYYIKDNGAGFEMAYADKLFGVFQRLHSQQEFEGSGVGLALVKRIIDKHNGKIWAEGAENAGATFYFRLSGELS